MCEGGEGKGTVMWRTPCIGMEVTVINLKHVERDFRSKISLMTILAHRKCLSLISPTSARSCWRSHPRKGFCNGASGAPRSRGSYCGGSWVGRGGASVGSTSKVSRCYAALSFVMGGLAAHESLGQSEVLLHKSRMNSRCIKTSGAI